VSIFGGYQRLNTFYKDNRRLLAERLKLEEGAENLPTDEFIRRLYVSFMEECGLWEELKKLLDRLMNETHLVPFTFLRVLTAVFCQLDRLMNSEIVRPHSELLLQSTQLCYISLQTQLRSRDRQRNQRFGPFCN
jgi:hypothetical protein